MNVDNVVAYIKRTILAGLSAERGWGTHEFKMVWYDGRLTLVTSRGYIPGCATVTGNLHKPRDVWCTKPILMHLLRKMVNGNFVSGVEFQVTTTYGEIQNLADLHSIERRMERDEVCNNDAIIPYTFFITAFSENKSEKYRELELKQQSLEKQLKKIELGLRMTSRNLRREELSHLSHAFRDNQVWVELVDVKDWKRC